MAQQSSYSYEDILDCSNGKIFGEKNARLPLPPMLMVSRITKIVEEGGNFNKGFIRAEYDITPEDWFFQCHFNNDPVMPGCLGLDAMWQLIGFFLGWSGGKGRGRALGVGEVKFYGQVLPTAKKVEYKIDIKRVIKRSLYMGVADAFLEVDGREIYSASNLKVGLFTSMDNFE